MGTHINHISYTQLSTYLACPLRYRFQYVEMIPPAFTPSALVFGQCLHEAAAAFHEFRLMGDDLSPSQLADIFRQCWRNKGDREIRFCNGDDEASLFGKAERMLSVFRNSRRPDVEIVGVEEFFEAPISPSVPPLQGYIDLIEQCPDGRIIIVDLKSAARKPTQSHAATTLQLTAYSIGAASLGFDPAQLGLRLDVLTKTKNPELIRYETSRTDDERLRFVRLAESVWDAIEREVWFPREDWHCAQCAWANHCRNW